PLRPNLCPKGQRFHLTSRQVTQETRHVRALGGSTRRREMRSRHLIMPAIALSSLIATSLVGAVPAGASAGARSYLIGVDAGGPAGHNFEYVDYFPRGQVRSDDPPAIVGNGAVLDFRYNLASLDGLHTATL